MFVKIEVKKQKFVIFLVDFINLTFLSVLYIINSINCFFRSKKMKKNLIFCIILCLISLCCCDVDCSNSDEKNPSKKITYYKIICHYEGLTPASGYQLDNLTYDGSFTVNLPSDIAFVLESNEYVSFYIFHCFCVLLFCPDFRRFRKFQNLNF